MRSPARHTADPPKLFTGGASLRDERNSIFRIDVLQCRRPPLPTFTDSAQALHGPSGAGGPPGEGLPGDAGLIFGRPGDDDSTGRPSFPLAFISGIRTH